MTEIERILRDSVDPARGWPPSSDLTGRWSTQGWGRADGGRDHPEPGEEHPWPIRSAGNKDEAFDAYVLADVLRTDRARLQPLTRDSDATVTLRMTMRAPQDLVHALVAMASFAPTCRPRCQG